jgi:dTDP-4-dehydrorhamnose reductase
VREFAPSADVVPLGRSELDITDDLGVRTRVESEAPDVIVNCAAFNAVDAAEDNPVTALQVNACGVRALAIAAQAVDARFVHYGTDFVFDGRTDRPYVETDAPNPQSTYAVSKLLGEWFAADVARWYVLRVASLFGRVEHGPSGSADTIIDRIEAGSEVPVFADRTVSPTYVVDAAATTRALLEQDAPCGVYHCVNSGRCSWLEFAEEAAQALGRAARLKPITLESVAMRASRPRYAALSNATLARLGFELPPWEDALRRSLHARARA